MELDVVPPRAAWPVFYGTLDGTRRFIEGRQRRQEEGWTRYIAKTLDFVQPCVNSTESARSRLDL
eukprot:684016-Amphidinium_carterae.2